MAMKRLSMRQIRQVLRLRLEHGLTTRAIARACSVGLGTVTAYLTRAHQAGLTWPLPDDLDDSALEALLYPRGADVPGPRPLPDFAGIHKELRRTGVTLLLLWMEYLKDHPGGYQYSQFCDRYRRWTGKLNPSMRQVHRAGEKAFVDFSGKKPTIIDPDTGEIVKVELFVGALGASSYIYAEVVANQDLPCWISAHIRMFEAWQGSPAILVPDYVAGHIIRLMFGHDYVAGRRKRLSFRGGPRAAGEHNDLQRTQPGQHGRVVLPDSGGRGVPPEYRKTARRQAGPSLCSGGDLRVPVGAPEIDVTEPAADDVDFHARLQKMHGRGVAEEVWGHASGAVAGGVESMSVPADDLVDPKARQRDTGTGAEHGPICGDHLGVE